MGAEIEELHVGLQSVLDQGLIQRQYHDQKIALICRSKSCNNGRPTG